ncbi:putative pyruvate dehydrogenase [Aureobasidium sp. EXF-10727]|nr:putative pyruvate dehydrogenase [Aureobasidium sp. EXF-10727]
MQAWRLARPSVRHLLRAPIRFRASTTRSYSSQSAVKGATYTITASVLAGIAVWQFTATRDDAPMLEIQEPQLRPSNLGLSKEDVTKILSREAFSFPVKSVSGVERYDGAQVASNSVSEDRFVHGKLPSPRNDGNPWMAWAAFDGHAGWQTADLLEKQLLPLVQQYLIQANLSPEAQSGYTELTQQTIIKAFIDLDDSLIETARKTSESTIPLQEKMQRLLPAFAGSCALVSLFDPVTSTLHVACTGDSRAVLGQKNADGTWTATPLSIDQTGSNAEEIARIHRQHPNEEDIVKNGRVLGLMVSRAFGDGRWKWPQELQTSLQDRFFAPGLPKSVPEAPTPPYITAEPVVTSTVIDSGTPSFLILATDGLWDMLSNQQAVDLVGTWLDSQSGKLIPSKSQPSYAAFDFSHFKNGVDEKFEEQRATTEDKNAAVHLMRNALGGNHQELIAGRLAASAPISRDLRDDVTVQVAFFNCGV